ncbi:hypothetical protein ACWD4G_07075 [Streptomyces sp. NPDC002643]
MRNKARFLVAATAATAIMGLSVPGATAVSSSPAQASQAASAKASKWACTGKKLRRCIIKVAENKVKVSFTNKTGKAVRGPYGVVCLGEGGQKFVELRKSSLGAHKSWMSKVYTCKPKRLSDGARGFQDTNDPVNGMNFTPTIYI